MECRKILFSLLLTISLIVLLIFLFTYFVFSSSNAEENVDILNASCGPIRGNIYRHKGRIVDGYLGIPFAKPPINELRFQKPEAIEKWNETKDCYSYGPGCPQSGLLGGMVPDKGFGFAEDNCLTLNVFSPRSNSNSTNRLPVMVYFYGGGYEIGSSFKFSDSSIAKSLPLKNVIVVTLNYRLGPLGFFTTGTSLAPGNNGLWDQILALKWVQSHIRSFGGDPDKVTIFGSSAGASSADLLSLSPHARGLFHRSILLSGTANCDFAIRTKQEESTIFREFAKFHGYTGTDEDSKSLLKWFRSQPAYIFWQMDGFQRNASGFLDFVPNLDGELFPAPIDQLRKNAPKIDVMITMTQLEGLSMLLYYQHTLDPYQNLVKFINETFGDDLVDNIVRQGILDYYMKDLNRTDLVGVQNKFIEFIGDSWFNSGALDSARSLVQNGNSVYFGSFEYVNKSEDEYATTHGSDLKYIFADVSQMNEDEIRVSEMMADLLTNFAKTGNPNKSWTPYSLSEPLKYYKMDLENSRMMDNYQDGRLKMYDEINKQSRKYQEIMYGL